MRIRFNRALIAAGFPPDWYLVPLAGVIGALAGVVAAGFDAVLNYGLTFIYGGDFSHGHSAWRVVLVLLAPAGGGLLVGIIQQYIARSGPTHGVPDVMESLARHHGQIPARVGVFKAITASLTIASGGSGGVEGPIIQIGSTVGSVVGQIVRVSREHMNTLVGAGAAAALAAIFNAPIAGMLFVLEVLLRDFSVRTFIPIVFASVIGTAVEQAIRGNHAMFLVPPAMGHYQASLVALWAYALLGVAAGVVGVLYAKGLHATEDWMFHWVPRMPKVLRPAVGGLLLGVLGVVFMMQFGRPVATYQPPPFYSNGYPVIEALLNPASYPGAGTEGPRGGDKETRRQGGSFSREAQQSASPEEVQSPATSHSISPTFVGTGLVVIVIILVLKLAGTCLSLGSGGSGGKFAPSLVMGTMLGALCGMGFQQVHLIPASATPATFALAGMAGVLAAAVHCPLTAFFLVFELTQDYKLILPVMLVAIVATAVSQMFSRDSIYTASLRRRGIRMGTFSDMTLLRRLDVSHVPLTPAGLVHPQEPAQRLIELAEEYAAVDYVVVDDEDGYVGMVVGEEVRATLVQREAVPLMIVGELMRTNLPTATRDETLDVVLDKFSRHDVASLAVVDENRVVKGVITRSRLMRQYHRALEEA